MGKWKSWIVYLLTWDLQLVDTHHLDVHSTPENLRLKMETDNLRHKLQKKFVCESLQECRGNVKQKWKLIERFWPFLKNETHIRDINGRTEDMDKTRSINECFVNIANNLASDIDTTLVDKKYAKGGGAVSTSL